MLPQVAGTLGYAAMPEPPATLPWNFAELVPASLARAYGVMPVREDAQGIELLAADPFDSDLIDKLAFALSRNVRLLGCEPDRLARLVRQYCGEGENLADGQRVEATDGLASNAGSEPTAHDLEAMAGQPPVVRLVSQVLAQAIRDRASDLHFEPFEREFKIRVRVDGALCELPSPSRALALPVISRIKVLANLNIAERRVPQDGRIRTALDGRAVDVRVSTLPTQFGESVVLRVLDPAAVQLDLRELGLPEDVRPGVQDIIRRPNGILLVTGPTGSGKTTTLYSGLRAINTPGLKLLTIEDPVEYEIEGIMQVPVNPVAGLTFASALRSFLRQDPDVIMVGEIRDLETAEIAIQAALTGHLVFSTLHTNDAPAAVTRLLNMGVEPFLLASTVEAILAQRLVRRICPHCRTEYEPSPALLAQLGLRAPAEHGGPFFHGRGCGQCGHTGYRGRMGIFEWLVLTESLRERVTQKAPVQLIRQQARELGMRTLREDAVRAVCAGATTLEEIAKHT